jgi:hypothetical protein
LYYFIGGSGQTGTGTGTGTGTMPSLKPPMIKGKYENKILESHIL